MRLRKLALLLAVVGLVCLPAPVYLPALADATSPPPKVSNSYRAETVSLANQSDIETIVNRHGRSVSISVHQVSQRYSAGEYRAPNETRGTLEAAMRNGTARTTAAGAQVDLRAIARNNTYVHDAYGEREQYYRLRVRENGSVVTARNATLQRVANTTVERSAYSYANLSPAARGTVDSILRNSSDGDLGYRPRMNDAFVDRLPALVEKEGTRYSITAYTHVDDFGFGAAFVVGLGVAGVGAVLILVGGAVYAIAWWRE
ncbi:MULTISPECIES: hypothetical protein [unclassified Haloferax]|uniref:Uncharacterized protein n=1 Tax=Haloferax sp. Atlit-48N TaxID=2077198 RepID=A0ACD5I0U6_9EURY|nr:MULTISPECIES: hypothetical protein [unclassified Haloferax]RDZ30513.1 hypothetical protein DEQ67_13140 [Haloferax sp. Atlit-48N]RDZ33554.1 hypothetical protein C5B88_17310 [Haloferax sp. Atlit-24N]RDZ35861.1 hypothetical protein C5B89_16565 [Haloferax sp. Atlit-47N]RLM34340.1 hypothetical protein DVK03_17480 [Haloferax sp. Atlit-109R]RLM41158.1 hypothetical protein DVK04_17295 [Haloferax sp. Atlit-105R]